MISLHQKKYWIKESGFTLTEILIVVVILAILAALVLPRFSPQGERARASEATAILSSIRQGEEAYFLENGVYLAFTGTSTNWGSVGMQNPNGNGFFGYVVNIPAGGATFAARATRNATSDSSGQVGKVIGIDQTGIFCGNHSNTPQNAGVAAGACS